MRTEEQIAALVADIRELHRLHSEQILAVAEMVRERDAEIIRLSLALETAALKIKGLRND